MEDLSSPQIDTTGVLCEGQLVKLGWPEEWEFDAITALRNELHVRKWFLDSRPLDPQANREWLRTGMKRPYEAVLSIRWKEDDSFLGTIGWSDWNAVKGTAWFGRLAVDRMSLRKIIKNIPGNYVGIAVDSALALRDFAFTSMKLTAILTYYFANNKAASHVNEAIGLLKSKTTRRSFYNKEVETIEMKMTFADYTKLLGGK